MNLICWESNYLYTKTCRTAQKFYSKFEMQGTIRHNIILVDYISALTRPMTLQSRHLPITAMQIDTITIVPAQPRLFPTFIDVIKTSSPSESVATITNVPPSVLAITCVHRSTGTVVPAWMHGACVTVLTIETWKN